jgi:hypothetical protein
LEHNPLRAAVWNDINIILNDGDDFGLELIPDIFVHFTKSLITIETWGKQLSLLRLRHIRQLQSIQETVQKWIISGV